MSSTYVPKLVAVSHRYLPPLLRKSEKGRRGQDGSEIDAVMVDRLFPRKPISSLKKRRNLIQRYFGANFARFLDLFLPEIVIQAISEEIARLDDSSSLPWQELESLVLEDSTKLQEDFANMERRWQARLFSHASNLFYPHEVDKGRLVDNFVLRSTGHVIPFHSPLSCFVRDVYRHARLQRIPDCDARAIYRQARELWDARDSAARIPYEDAEKVVRGLVNNRYYPWYEYEIPAMTDTLISRETVSAYWEDAKNCVLFFLRQRSWQNRIDNLQEHKLQASQQRPDQQGAGEKSPSPFVFHNFAPISGSGQSDVRTTGETSQTASLPCAEPVRPSPQRQPSGDPHSQLRRAIKTCYEDLKEGDEESGDKAMFRSGHASESTLEHAALSPVTGLLSELKDLGVPKSLTDAQLEPIRAWPLDRGGPTEPLDIATWSDPEFGYVLDHTDTILEPPFPWPREVAFHEAEPVVATGSLNHEFGEVLDADLHTISVPANNSEQANEYDHERNIPHLMSFVRETINIKPPLFKLPLDLEMSDYIRQNWGTSVADPMPSTSPEVGNRTSHVREPTAEEPVSSEPLGFDDFVRLHWKESAPAPISPTSFDFDQLDATYSGPGPEPDKSPVLTAQLLRHQAQARCFEAKFGDEIGT